MLRIATPRLEAAAVAEGEVLASLEDELVFVAGGQGPVDLAAGGGEEIGVNGAAIPGSGHAKDGDAQMAEGALRRAVSTALAGGGAQRKEGVDALVLKGLSADKPASGEAECGHGAVAVTAKPDMLQVHAAGESVALFPVPGFQLIDDEGDILEAVQGLLNSRGVLERGESATATEFTVTLLSIMNYTIVYIY